MACGCRRSRRARTSASRRSRGRHARGVEGSGSTDRSPEAVARRQPEPSAKIPIRKTCWTSFSRVAAWPTRRTAGGAAGSRIQRARAAFAWPDHGAGPCDTMPTTLSAATRCSARSWAIWARRAVASVKSPIAETLDASRGSTEETLALSTALLMPRRGHQVDVQSLNAPGRSRLGLVARIVGRFVEARVSGRTLVRARRVVSGSSLRLVAFVIEGLAPASVSTI